MKSIAIGVVAAVALATFAGFVLQTEVQTTAAERYQTSGVRL